jgi:hypothetical protein
VQQLAQLGATDPTFRSSVAAEVGTTPTLFETPEAPRRRHGIPAESGDAGGQ